MGRERIEILRLDKIIPSKKALLLEMIESKIGKKLEKKNIKSILRSIKHN